MPLYKLEEIKPDRHLAIWHIEESFHALFAMLDPSREDQCLIADYKNENKKLEWLTGRICLKHLCMHTGLNYMGVVKNANGKPFLKNSHVEISLTHSFPYVAAIMDQTHSVGIDLEQPRGKLKRVAHKFLNDDELERTHNDLQALCIHWCAKETLYKICDKPHLSFKNAMQVEGVIQPGRGTLTGTVALQDIIKRYKLEYRIEKDYIITFNV